jgi:predicted HTH transcriptional regulator
MTRDIRASRPAEPALPLFARDEPPRRTANQRTRWATQDEAFASAPGGVAARLLESIRTDGPATCDELEQRLDLSHQTASASVNHLMRAGILVANGSRPTRSGRRARIWEISDGRSILQQ